MKLSFLFLLNVKNVKIRVFSSPTKYRVLRKYVVICESVFDFVS